MLRGTNGKATPLKICFIVLYFFNKFVYFHIHFMKRYEYKNKIIFQCFATVYVKITWNKKMFV